MPQLLLELFSEEIPARMQARAAEDLKKAVTDRLVDAGLVYEGAKAFVTPRRLTLAVHGVPVRQPDLRELAGRLKKRCGVGGSVKDGVIELQGDHRTVVLEVLKAEGYDAVLGRRTGAAA